MIEAAEVAGGQMAPFPPSTHIEESPRRLVVGVDLGQSNDFTAIAIDEVVERRTITSATPKFQALPVETVKKDAFHRVRHLERMRGVSYPDVVARVAELYSGLPTLRHPPGLIVDATGVGRAVVDLMREKGLPVDALTITSGHADISPKPREHHVPKKNLINLLQVLMQGGRVVFSGQLQEAETLKHELANLKVRISRAGNEQFDTWRENIHDDLVFAVAIALWMGEQKPKSPIVIGRWGELAGRKWIGH